MAETEVLFARLSGEEATRTLMLAEALKVYAASEDRAGAARAIARRLAEYGVRGLSKPSLDRKLARFRAEGVWGLVDPRRRRDFAEGMAGNGAFAEYWRGLVLGNRRKVKPAWRKLLSDFALGAAVPGVGTWRELYFRERGYRPAAGEPCPWGVGNPPPGWSLRSLMRLKPSGFALTAARVGMKAAQLGYGFTVVKTRVGLSCCRVVEVDDMWYEHMVIFPGNAEPQRVVEFAAMDRLTGHVICHLTKPIRERADGTRETLRSVWARYVYAYVLCVSGIPAEGCVFRGEHGTTREDDCLTAALAAINTARDLEGLGRVTFEAGSILTRAIGKGLAKPKGSGNPRHKGMIEQMHATLKNELGAVLGEVGGGRGVQPEDAEARVAEDRKLIADCGGGLVRRMVFNFPHWEDFAAAAAEAHRRMDERTDHALEGWEKCGFTVGEVRLRGTAHWMACEAVEAMAPERAAALRAMTAAGMAEYRARRMSPAEAWARRKGELRPVGAAFAPLILGAELCRVCRVSDGLKMRFRNTETGEDYPIAAVIGGTPLERGAEYRVWVNPLDAGRAYVQNMKGQFLGVARVLQAARADADAEDEALRVQLGIRQAALKAGTAELAPLAAARRRGGASVRRRRRGTRRWRGRLGRAARTKAAPSPAARWRRATGWRGWRRRARRTWGNYEL